MNLEYKNGQKQKDYNDHDDFKFTLQFRVI
jgi:hypothetical protein